MKVHLFEFKSENRKLKCLCGWQRTLKSADVKAAYAKFEEHRAAETRPSAN